MTLLKIGLVLIVLSIHSGWTQQLRIATVNMSAPYIIAHEDGTKEGFIIDLLNEMEVDFEIVSPLDNRYGKKDPNTGKWNGLVGMVIDGKADAVGQDLTMTQERAGAVDFTVPFMDSQLVIMAKEKRMTTNVISLVFAPFSAHLWILTILAYLVTSLVFWLISRLSPLEQTECLWESLWGIISAFVYVSRPAPTPCSRRLVLIGWWIFAVILFVAYAVSLQPIIASGKVAFRYKSVEDMLSNPDFRFGTFKGGATNQLLKNSEDDIHNEIYTRMMQKEEENFFSGNSKMIDFLKQEEVGDWGMIMESHGAKYFLPNYCDFYIVGSLASRYFGFAVPKGNSNRESLSQKVLKASESGALQTLKSKWWPEGDCTDAAVVGSSAEKSMEVDIPHVGGAFVLLLVFLIVGLLVALYELVNEIKNEPQHGPLGRALKEAFCGCFPPITRKPKAGGASKKEEEIETTLPAEEKQNGAENIA